MFLIKRSQILLALILLAVSPLGCGVKGPPEAPYPTEASTKKGASGDPAPVPFAVPKTAADQDPITVPAKTTKKKKTK